MEHIDENNVVLGSSSIGNKLNDFKILSELGKGSYGVVYKVLSNLNKKEYVIKKMEISQMTEKQQKEAWKEANILKRVRHENVIKYNLQYFIFLKDFTHVSWIVVIYV